MKARIIFGFLPEEVSVQFVYIVNDFFGQFENFHKVAGYRIGCGCDHLSSASEESKYFFQP